MSVPDMSALGARTSEPEAGTSAGATRDFFAFVVVLVVGVATPAGGEWELVQLDLDLGAQLGVIVGEPLEDSTQPCNALVDPLARWPAERSRAVWAWSPWLCWNNLAISEPARTDLGLLLADVDSDGPKASGPDGLVADDDAVDAGVVDVDAAHQSELLVSHATVGDAGR